VQIGPSHPAVKQVQSLQRSGGDDTLTVAEGFWASEAVVDTGVPVRLFLYCPELLRPEASELAARLRAVADEAYEVSVKTVQRVSERDKPDGLVSVVQLPRWTPGDLRPGSRSLVLVADGIEQPGNLGTLVRTLDACGADALILTNTRTKPTNVKVFRASHGTILRIPTLSFDSVGQASGWLHGNGFGVFLADTDAAARYTDVDFADRTAIVMGSERFGIDRDWYTDTAQRVFIPMLGAADSLNVSISAAVLLYEARSRLAGWR
jgi:RNA methyltransferase, TrmH family